MVGIKPLLIWLVAMVALASSLCAFFPKAQFTSRAPMATSSASVSASSSWSTIWLHGLGDNGPNNAPLRHQFNFSDMKWHFPSAPSQPVSCNYGAVMPSWFDIQEIPITANSPNNEEDLLVAVRKIHEMLDKQVSSGISADKIFLCGFSQGGALTLASALSYPKKLGGAAVFSGWVPFNASFLERVQEGKQTPLLWLHGIDDPVVHFKAGQVAPPLLSKYGIHCEFKAYPGLQHNISPDEFSDLNQWITEKISSHN